MGLYQRIADAWKQPRQTLGDIYKQRMVQWRTEPVTLRIERPTRIDRARKLGYKAKEGFIMVRQHVKRGGHSRPRIRSGRRSKRFGKRKNLMISYQLIAEQRAARKYRNLEVLNSYWVGDDSDNYYYEVILVDPLHPVIMKDKNVNWISEKQHTRRVFRSLTSAGRKSRGLLTKGKGAEKLRPSLGAHKHLGK
jgi:large subunit ribosomal protein L15e